jgi:hypothetical protein
MCEEGGERRGETPHTTKTTRQQQQTATYNILIP